MKTVVGFSGSVATVKCFQLLGELSKLGPVAAVFTEAAWGFFDAAQIYDPDGAAALLPNMVFAWETQEAKVPSAPPADSKAIHVYRDSNEWQYYGQVGKDPVLHIEVCVEFCWVQVPHPHRQPNRTTQLRKWADLLLIAPCSANTLAKLAGGLADNLLTCIARAWEVGQKPMLIAPAMNTAMWEHPLTSRHLAVVTDILCGVVVPPQPTKRLACGDSGAGALATIPAILDAVQASAQHGDGQEHAPATPGGSAAPSVPAAASSTGGP